MTALRFGLFAVRLFDLGQHLLDLGGIRSIGTEFEVESHVLCGVLILLFLGQDYSQKMIDPGRLVLGIELSRLPGVTLSDVDFVQVVVGDGTIEINLRSDIRI